METKQKPISIVDAESIQNSIIQIVMKYENLPFKPTQANVLWNNLATGRGIGLFPLQGAVYTRKYVSGLYTALYPFRIVYRSAPKSNAETIDSQNILDELSKWMETCSISIDGISIDKIERTSQTFPIGQTEQDQEYAINMAITYTGRS